MLRATILCALLSLSVADWIQPRGADWIQPPDADWIQPRGADWIQPRDARRTDNCNEEEVCRRQPLDLGFVIDTSASIAKSDFELGLWFVKDIISLFDVGPKGSRIAAVTFADKNYEHFNLDSYLDKTHLTNAVVHLKYMSGKRTNTGEGIQHMTQELARHGRPNVEHVAVVITDGNSQEGHLTALAARDARAKGIKVFAVGVGPKVSMTELEAIAGKKNNVFTVGSYDMLNTIKSSLAYKTCGQEPALTIVCRDKPLDISFVIDASTSIGQSNFDIGKDFVKEFVEKFNIGPRQTRISVVTFSNTSNPESAFGFDAHRNEAGVLNAISRLPWKTGNTATGDGIDFMRNNQMSKRRRTAGHICIVMTDGQSQDGEKTKQAARKARKTGINIFAVGIGHGISDQELNNIAGSRDHVFKVADYASLVNIKEELDQKTCKSALRELGDNHPY